jgi:hypothetical protein
MQVQTANISATTLPNLRDLRGLNVTEVLSNMPIGTSKADGYFIEIEKERNIRSMIYQLRKSERPELSAMRFETEIAEGGIVIWRTA